MRRDIHFVEEADDLVIHSDQAVKAAQRKAGKGVGVERLRLGGGRISAGMKGEDGFRAGTRRTRQTEREDAVGKHAAEMLMDYVAGQAGEQSQQLSGAFRVIDFIGIGPAMTGDIDDRARDATAQQE